MRQIAAKLLLSMGVSLIAAISAQAESPSDTISAADFVSQAGMDGMTEVQAAQLALQKSRSRRIKQFAEQMVGDHTQANQRLMDIASSKRLKMPTELDAAHRSMLQSLGAKSGSAFDAAFLSQMAVSHDKAIALFTSARGVSDPDVAAFATKTLPTLQMHKQMASATATASPKISCSSSPPRRWSVQGRKLRP